MSADSVRPTGAAAAVTSRGTVTGHGSRPRATPGPPGVSIVVPTFGAPTSVERLLASLRVAARRLPDEVGREIIVVDDSRPDAAARIRELCRQFGAQYVCGPRRVGTKRNVGARLARYPIMFFIDSDCIAEPNLLCEHLAAHAAYGGRRAPSGRPVGAVAGPTEVVEPDRPPAWRVVAPSVVVNSAWLWPQRFAEVWWAATANLSVRREAFEAVGGFDEETFTVVGGEDVDFGVRLTAAGYATVCRTAAVARHATDGITRVGQFRAKMFRYGRACAYNCTRQPQHAAWAGNPVSLAAIGLAAAAGCTAAGRSWTARQLAAGTLAVLAAAFGARTVRAARRHDMSIAAAAQLVSVDWAFHAGIAAEAIRRGRPLLALQRYDYFPSDRFYPAPAAADRGQEPQ